MYQKPDVSAFEDEEEYEVEEDNQSKSNYSYDENAFDGGYQINQFSEEMPQFHEQEDDHYDEDWKLAMKIQQEEESNENQMNKFVAHEDSQYEEEKKEIDKNFARAL